MIKYMTDEGDNYYIMSYHHGLDQFLTSRKLGNRKMKL